MLLGVNGQLLFGPYGYHDPITAQRYRETGFKHIRFPGGTVANYYNPLEERFTCARATTPRAAERLRLFEDARTANHGRYTTADCLRFVRATNTELQLVLNVSCMTVTETQAWLRKIRAQGVFVDRIEMGNELHFREYEWAFENGEKYVAACANHADAVKDIFPGAKIGMPVSQSVFQGNNPSPRLRDFDNAVAQAEFCDANILHLYADTGGGRTPRHAFLNAMYHITTGLNRQQLALNRDRETWVTEFGIKRNNTLIDTDPLYALACGHMAAGIAEFAHVANFHNLNKFWLPNGEPNEFMIRLFRELNGVMQ